MKNAARVWSIALVLSSVVGCGAEYGDLCKKQMDCEGGNDKDKEACAEAAEGEENAADAYGCLDQFNSYADCLRDSSTCKPNPGGRSSFTPSDACITLGKVLNDCIKAATSRK